MPFFSIIVPVYNTEKYLERCINSIVDQTFKDWELILIDDGSTDKSGKICDKYLILDERVYVEHKKNNGVSAARNRGLEIAKGEYITFIDSDDWIDLDFLEKVYAKIKNKDLDIIMTECVLELEKKSVNRLKEKKFLIINKNEAIKDFFLQKRLSWVIWSKFFKKELFIKFKFNEKLRIAEDTLLFWQLLNNIDKIGYFPIYKYHHNIQIENTMSSEFSLKWFDGIQVKRKLYKEVKDASKELRLLSKIVCIIDMVILLRKAIKSKDYNTKRLIKLLQRQIRKSFYVVFLYPFSNIMTLRQRLGILFFCLPYNVCKLLKNKI